MRERKIEAAMKKKGEFEAMILDGDFEEEKASFFTRIRRRLFRTIVLGGKKPTEETLKELEDEIATLKAEVTKMDESELMNLGSAVVTFNYEEHAMNACDDHMNDGWDWTVASVSRKFPPDFNGRRLIVQRATRTERHQLAKLERETDQQRSLISFTWRQSSRCAPV